MAYLTLACILADAFVLTIAWRYRFEFAQWQEKPLYSKIFLASIAAGAVASTTVTLLVLSLYLGRA